jgi:hypothetical protein
MHCDNPALCWLLKTMKDVGCLGSWILRLVPFKFKIKHAQAVDNVVADALLLMFEGDPAKTQTGLVRPFGTR